MQKVKPSRKLPVITPLEAQAVETAQQEQAAANDDALAPEEPEPIQVKERSRKRRRDNDDLEGAYMQKLAKEEAKEEAQRREAKRQKALEVEKPPKKAKKEKKVVVAEDAVAGAEAETSEAEEKEMASADEQDAENEDIDEAQDGADLELITSNDEPYIIPQHESLSKSTTATGTNPGNPDLEKASRTVFLGNVSTTAITSKPAKTALLAHLTSIFTSLPTPAKDAPPYNIESLRFRSTPFSTPLPKKAAFARKDLMPATTAATNAYCVYSHPAAARAAAATLNGTVVLDRHLRVDSIAHPAATDHRRCVFVGNLGFVDDASAVRAANAAEDAARRGEDAKKPRVQKSKPVADTEEGLWRVFGKAGTVESVRVVRDPKTRVGKGFAYVQFHDANAVEAALLYNEKKFPPLLPRVLRVVRAKRPVSTLR